MYVRLDKVSVRVLFVFFMCAFFVSTVYAEEPVSEPQNEGMAPVTDVLPYTEEVIESEPVVATPLPSESPETIPENLENTDDVPPPVSPSEVSEDTLSVDTEATPPPLVPDVVQSQITDVSPETSEGVSESVTEDTVSEISATTTESIEEVTPPLVIDAALPLTRTDGESSLFTMDTPLVFTLTSDIPLQTIHEDEKEQSESFIDEIVEVVSDVGSTVVDAVAAVVDTLAEVVVEVMADAREFVGDTPYDARDESETLTVEATSTDMISQEGVDDVVVGEIVEEMDTQSESSELQVTAFIDGVPVSSSYTLHDMYTVVADVRPDTIEPGVHIIRIEILFDGKRFAWEGVCTWGGTVVYSKEVESGVWAIVLEQVEGGTALFLQEYNGTTFTYSSLDTSFTFAQASSIAVFENTLFWLSTGKDVLHGYDILSRTQFSQSLSQTDTSEVILHETVFRISTRTAAPQFTSVEKPLK
jgi:hypothetical protein